MALIDDFIADETTDEGKFILYYFDMLLSLDDTIVSNTVDTLTPCIINYQWQFMGVFSPPNLYLSQYHRLYGKEYPAEVIDYFRERVDSYVKYYDGLLKDEIDTQVAKWKETLN